jgi:tRNA (guanine37-N1)-methyltransferase
MKFDILTLFPDFFTSPLSESIMARAIDSGIVEVKTHNIRDYSTDTHRSVDDAPYGGGAGMVMRVEPIVAAIEDVRGKGCKRGKGGRVATAGASGDKETYKKPLVVMATPQGEPFTHRLAEGFSKYDRLIILSGRYEGFDERIRSFVDKEVSIGDYVLTGGEIPALVIMDAVIRFIPGVLGDEDSVSDDSFSPALDGLLEYPQYTRPREFRSMMVPDVLLSGNHAEIEKWRRQESIRRTQERRPELLKDKDRD